MEMLTLNGLNCAQLMNICRCCLTKGCCYKEISTEHYNSGQKEVYEDMLKQTFDIQISTFEHPNLRRNLICEGCITSLRQAYAFKETVLRSEELIIKYLKEIQSNQECDDMRPYSEVDDDAIKQEVVHEDEPDCDKLGDEDSFDDDNELLADVKMELAKEQTPVRRKRKSHELRTTKKSRIIDDSCITKKQEKDWLKIAERRGNGPILRENSLKLIANSTICVFQWNKSRYRCFCCKEPFSDMNLLREHTNTNHSVEEIGKIIITQQNRLVKVEISLIVCKICNKKFENLESLRVHLAIHDVKFDINEDLLVPFKIGSLLHCQICGENFSMFRHLNIHMNKHFQKQVCHICGAGFSNLVFLNLHKTRSHRPLNCKECNVNFNNKMDKKDHDINVHNLKIERKLRFPCPYCSERFFQENFRVQHLVEKHGMARPEHKCSLCSKVFITKSLLNNHVKNVHMKEKNHECDVCHHLFYTKSDVARHKVTHTGEKKFSCNMCNTLFASRDSLRRHIKRTHAGMS